VRDHLRVELLTIGPGQATWSRFGHSALRFTDLRGRGDIVFDFGTFDEEQPNVVGRFLQGRLQYSLSVSTFAETRREYRAQGRAIEAQVLRLAPDQERRLFRRLRWLTRPENRRYDYHPYRNNCATRIRDELDRLLDGALRAQLQGVPAGTHRQWIHRATRGAPGFHVLFDLVLTRSDRPIDLWQAGFAPEALRAGINRVRVHASGARGTEPLVRSRRTLGPGARFGARQGDSRHGVPVWLWVSTLGLLLPLLVGRRGSATWRIAGLAMMLWGAFQGLLGSLFVGLQLYATVRQFTGNPLLVLFPPTGLIWIYPGLCLLRGRHPARRASRGLQGYGWAHPIGIVVCWALVTPWTTSQPWAPLWGAALLVSLAAVLVITVRYNGLISLREEAHLPEAARHKSDRFTERHSA